MRRVRPVRHQTPVDQLDDAVAAEAERGTAILLVEHDVPMVEKLAQRCYVIDVGRSNGKFEKIGVTARGAATETFMSWMLIKAGMQPDDVTFVAVGGPNTAYGALVSKQVDATMIFEPTGAICDVLKTCKRIYTAASDKEPAELYALNGGGSNLVFTQEYIDRNPNVIEAVIKAVKDADAFINAPANFEEVVKIAESFF